MQAPLSNVRNASVDDGSVNSIPENEPFVNTPKGRKAKRVGSAVGMLEKTMNAISYVNMLVEQAPRLAEFISVMEKGDMNSQETLAKALLAAADVTVNFGESGTLGKVLNAYYIPFLNPSIQGTSKVVRAFTGKKSGKEWLMIAAKTALITSMVTPGMGAATKALSRINIASADGSVYNQGITEGSDLSGQGEVDNSGIRRRIEVYDSGKPLSEGTGSSRIYETNSETPEVGVYGRRSGEDVYSSDSEGIEINETDFGRVKETAIKTESGQPIAVYHATPEMNFEVFEKSNDIGFHFGGVNQAKTRLAKKEANNGRIIRAYLNIKNPIRTRLDINSWKASHTGMYLWSEGYLTDAEWAEIQSLDVDGYDSPAAVRLREILAEKGYDGIVYPNGFEGDGDSYIAFSDDQIIKTEIRNASEDTAQGNTNINEDLFAHQEKLNNEVGEAVDGKEISTASSLYPRDTEKRAGAGFHATDYSKEMGRKTQRALDRIGKATGTEIYIGPEMENANGFYQDGKIVIAKNAKNPLEVVLSHEVTHSMEVTAPEAYAKFRDLALSLAQKKSGVSEAELVERYKTAYDGYLEGDLDAGARGEIVADFAKDIVNDVNLFRELIRSDMTVAERFVETVREVIAKIKSTFGGNTKGADNTVQEKYGVKVSELEAAVSLWEDMLAETKANLESGEINRAGETKYSIKEGPKGKYVKADRQVVEGETPQKWGESVERYINDKIRQGQDVQVVADNGDILTITADSAGKAKFRNYVKRADGTKTRMTDAEYLTKLNAESHIDELSKISKKGKKDVPDYKNHNFAKDGFNYRTAYFQDFDGKYYRLTLSVGKNGEINTVYNVGQINEAPFPLMAHRPDTKSVGGNEASTNSIPATPQNVNRKNSLKTEDLLSPEYGTQMQNDTSSTASGPPSPRGEGFGEQVGSSVAVAERTGEEGNVITKLKNNIEHLKNERSVRYLSGQEFSKGEKNLIDQVSEFFNSIGNKVTRKGFGDVILSRRTVKSDVAHGLSRGKAITFAAVPDVIKNGVQIDAQENWKGRGKDSYIFAAPVTINGKRGYVAAVVLKDDANKFYLHEVVDDKGDILYITKEDVSEPFKTSSSGIARIPRGKDTSSTNSIYENGEEVKGDADGTGLDGLFDDLHSRAEVIDDKRLADAEKIVKNSMNKDKSTLGEKLEKAESYAIRKMVNSGHALRKIANEVGDKFLYPIYNKTRSSSNIASDMIGRKQTDVLGREVGEGLEEIFSPIKEKGEAIPRTYKYDCEFIVLQSIVFCVLMVIFGTYIVKKKKYDIMIIIKLPR